MGWQDAPVVDSPAASKKFAWESAPLASDAATPAAPLPETRAPAPKSASVMDYLTAAPDLARSVVQNIGGAGLANAQAVVADLANRAQGVKVGKFDAQKQAEELAQRYGYQSKNPITQEALAGAGEIAKSEPIRLLAGVGPGGGVVGELGNIAQVGPAVNAALRPIEAGVEAAGNMKNAAGAAIRNKLDLVSGRTAERASGGVKSTITSEASSAANALEQEAAGLKQQASAGSPRGGVAEQEIANAKSRVSDKITKRAAAASETEKAHLDALGKPVSNEEIGDLIQKRGTENIDRLKSERQQEAITKIKDPAFEDARIRADKGDTLATNEASRPFLEKAVADLKQALADTPEALRGPMEKQIAALTSGNMTLHQGEYLRRWAGSAMEREKTGFAALDAGRMNNLKGNLTEAMKAYDPRVGKYLDEYKVRSEGIDKALGSNAGRAATDAIITEGDDIIRNQKPMQAHNYYMDGKQASAQKMVDLVGGKSQELTDAVKANLRSKLEGLTADQAMEMAVKNDGLLRVFPEIKPLVNQIVKSKFESEKLIRQGEEAGLRTKRAFDDATKAKNESAAMHEARSADAAKIAEGRQKIADSIKLDLAKMQDAPALESLAQARSMVDKLAKNKLIDEKRYQELLAQIRETDKVYGKTDSAKKVLKGILTTAIGSTAALIGIKAIGQ